VPHYDKITDINGPAAIFLGLITGTSAEIPYVHNLTWPRLNFRKLKLVHELSLKNEGEKNNKKPPQKNILTFLKKNYP